MKLIECDVCEKPREPPLLVNRNIKVCRQCLVDGIKMLDAKMGSKPVVETTAEEGAWETPSWDDNS